MASALKPTATHIEFSQIITTERPDLSLFPGHRVMPLDLSSIPGLNVAGASARGDGERDRQRKAFHCPAIVGVAA
jgi:hypothetical protein